MDTLYYRKGNLMRGLPVQRFQEFAEQVVGDVNWLETHGTKSGNDGYFGKDSEDLAKLVQAKLGLVVDGVVGPGTWSEIFHYLRVTDPTVPVEYVAPNGTKVIDGRGIWTPVKKFYGQMRPWNDTGDQNCIRGVMLHQTGCWMPEDPNVWRRINAHVGITRAGVLILMFPFEMLIWHGNGLTRPTIGVEIAGLFRGVESDPRSYWPREATTHEFNAEQERACEALYYIVAHEFEKHGGKWAFVYAHRQSSDMRMSDPGESVWKKIALDWKARAGGALRDGGPTYKVDSGKPVPSDWDPSYPAKFWG